ncbi:MAG: glycoside hydrolase family 2 protein, partial [Anaerolineae bacterium]|nr:glycoside hydrolase family 2 protein [Anaerolineae bacterium]
MVNKQTLNGEWTITSLGEREVSVTGMVPGMVHEALLQHDIIPDPFYQDQEQAQRWVGETDWRYERTFVVGETLLAHDCVLLRCHGLDTIATISINGREIGTTENMYRTYEFDVREVLHAGDNSISITFAAPMVYSRQQEAEHGVMPTWSVGDHRVDAGSYIRKEPSNFGWDWGPQLVTSGIWRDIELLAFNTGRIQDVQILQEHHDGTVDLTLVLQVERFHELPQRAEVRLKQGDETSFSLMIPIPEDGKATSTVHIAKPHLWWVNGMGEQPLYDLTITLKSVDDKPLDVVEKRIGLRTLRLDRHADEWGESFQFTCNGIPFFAKGANWIPGDVYVARMTREDYALPLRAAQEANMNMVRVWGGGIYESDDFYDLCDELGLAVWQDFMFACGTYPTTQEDFMANVRAEAEDNVRRLRHHASLALWCGNNELEMGLIAPHWTEHTMSWDDYGKLFDVLLAEVTAELSPETDYWPSSPHSPCGDRSDHINEDCGDGHLWAVWHGKQPFEWYRTMNSRFVSEFGFQSFPEPRTTNEFTKPEDRNLTSYVMEYHQRSPIGNATILHYMLDWFQMPTSFEMMSWLSQYLQAIGMKYAVEHWRRNMP